uniref:NADH dehydrogenase subunit 2 n=1 Tax=Mya japonica TaxID=1980395 RepID=UPI002A827E8E|nr:NADH dehydrogenase subunit 2 [Mya japonica]WNO18870.1 NADH dehydrogenase subunit 2 [Mya japonica]
MAVSRMGPSTVMCMLWVLSGLLGVVLSKGLFGVWFWLEWGFAGAICLVSGVSLEENEGAMKYFIFQSLGSMLIFFSFVMLSCGGLVFTWSGSLSGFVGMLIKLGMFPFHFWVPSVMGLISWKSCFLIGWVQKVGPLYVLSNFGVPSSMHGFLEVSALFTSGVGALGGMGVLPYRILIGYSSLVHSGWLVVICLCSSFLLWTYLFVYGVVFLFAVLVLGKKKLFSFLDHCNIYDGFKQGAWENEMEKIGILIHLSSLSGMPPFLGGMLKMLSVYVLWQKFPFSCLILIICSIVSFYFYLSLIMNCLVSIGTSPSASFVFKENRFYSSEMSSGDLLMMIIQVWGGMGLIYLLGLLN